MIEVRKMNVSVKKKNWIFFNTKKKLLKNITFNIKEGECLGIVGESGSGKSTLGKAIMGLIKIESGDIIFKDEKKSIVFQDYVSSVNPRFTVKEIIEECLKIRKSSEKPVKYLKLVGLNSEIEKRYPHELSGGQLQRVCIARALALKSKLILLDEATSSLDSVNQLQIMELLKELQKKLKLTYIFITHDLPSVTYMCDRVIFLKDGEIVEKLEKIENLKNVENEYVKKMLNSVMEI